ncbi:MULTISPECIES: zf-HC2 domain-containing protein [unclassified Amycolatopsis]|uniref:anti-sigma factor family protein n=1 Tax=unclassified Amycolatopsis TaxID=2618356 RepID=UPI0028752960|nr:MULTISPECIES: zf-HC2 domain-containing protein [unclassified Amycolatopsis]MDS0139864.1 zf-HC2 domain-containing protein [Amycolatopsis sp. 505]MDS0148224.1 zf-HC2 domain-containing protein [Amycolatopsis sp. CM201R]
MNSVDESHTQLGAYALGALDPHEAADFERRHLQTCAQCRFDLNELVALRDSLDEVPPEAFLEGPPEGGDLLLQKTLRRVRDEEERVAPPRSSRRGLALVAAAVLVVAALGGGVLVGRQTASDGGGTIAAPQSDVPGTKNVEGRDPTTGVQLAAAVAPFQGWVKVDVNVKGVKAGEKCLLQVVTKEGQAVTAGSWQVSEKWENQGFNLDGSALVAPDDVKSVDIVTVDGRKLVSAQV